MSEHEIISNARRLGRKAYSEGVSRSSNPMVAASSRQAWFDVWDEEEKFRQAADKAIEAVESGVDRHALKPNYFTQVDMGTD